MSQEELADRVRAVVYRATGHEAAITSKSISDYERGWYRWPHGDVRAALCQIFQVQTAEELGFRKPKRSNKASVPEAVDLAALGEGRVASSATESLTVPAGRSFLGAEISAHYSEADRVGSSVLLVDPTDELLTVLNRPDRRSLVIAVDGDRRQYVADGRRFLDRAGHRMGPQVVPLANVIDDLTVGIIWATANADSALLADDRELVRSREYVELQAGRPMSQGARDEVPTLNPVASQWLGSLFCSRYIVRNLGQLEGAPFFWTREQRGEEAAAWLLWSHKFEYLRRTSRRFANMRRGFCIPEDQVVASPRYERVMLLLAMSLMEAFGIQVELSAEPEHAEVEGFVLANKAIMANWLGSPGLWCVEASVPQARLTTYRKLAAEVLAESLTAQRTPVERLAALAAHLDVPWAWFRKRCTELAAAGVDDIAHPRGRLLSTRGLNTAIRYVAYIDVLEGDDFARR